MLEPLAATPGIVAATTLQAVMVVPLALDPLARTPATARLRRRVPRDEVRDVARGMSLVLLGLATLGHE